MKLSLIHLFFTLLLVIGVTACTDPLDKLATDPVAAEKQIESTHQVFSQVPGSQTEFYAAEIRHYRDGTADVMRRVSAEAPKAKPINVFVEGVSPKSSGASESFTLPDPGWYIPFDPAAQAISFAGGTRVEVRCICDVNGFCEAVGKENPDGSYTLTCYPWDCTGNCDGEVIIIEGRERIQVGSGMIVSSTTIELF